MSSKLEQLGKKINKEFKEEITGIGGVKYNRERVQTKSPSLNYMLYGGMPLYGMVEFSGAEGSGKTTMALSICSSYQKKFKDDYNEALKTDKNAVLRRAVFIDTENTLDRDWAEKMGVDVDSLIYIKPTSQTTEQILDIAREYIETGEVGYLCIDSIASMTSQTIYEESFEKRQYAGNSAPLTRFANITAGMLPKHQCLLIAINQLRDNLDAGMFGPETKTTGGRGFKHHCSVRIAFRQGRYINQKGEEGGPGSYENPAGHIVKMALIKTKICVADRKAGQFTLNYLKGLDVVADILPIAISSGIVLQAGSYFSLIKPDTGELYEFEGEDVKKQGKNNFMDYIAEHEELLGYLLDNISYNDSVE